MSKFVKVAALPPIDFKKLAFGMFKSFPQIQMALKTMFPGWNPLNPLDVTNKFLEALQDEEFQDLAITLAQQFISHRGQKLNINENLDITNIKIIQRNSRLF